jgi:pimeloyl-ACP methyl ester carboxylesterase
MFLDEWLAQPMFQALPHDDLERAARSSDARGLADSLRFSGTGTQTDLTSSLSSLDVPTLILAGANDNKFVTEAARLQNSFPRATTVLIPQAGHAAHLERPSEVAEAISAL